MNISDDYTLSDLKEFFKTLSSHELFRRLDLYKRVWNSYKYLPQYLMVKNLLQEKGFEL